MRKVKWNGFDLILVAWLIFVAVSYGCSSSGPPLLDPIDQMVRHCKQYRAYVYCEGSGPHNRMCECRQQ